MGVFTDNVFYTANTETVNINGSVRYLMEGKVDITEDLKASLPQVYLNITEQSATTLQRDVTMTIDGLPYYYTVFEGMASKPVNGHVDSRMTIVNTNYGNNTAATITFSGGTTCNIGGVDYYGGYCGPYAMYYLNQNRGWDCFLFEGNCYKSSEYKRMTSNKKQLRPSTWFGINTYRNQETDSYVLSTGRLNDKEAEIFASQLVPTQKAYLQDLATGDIVEGYIKDADVDYLNHRNNKNARAVYTVTFEKSKKQLW